MKKLLRFALLMLMAVVSLPISAQDDAVNMTATYAGGKVTLTYDDYANGAVEPGRGTITVWNEVAQVAELVGGDYTENYNELVYTVTETLEPGTYTVKVPAGAVKGNMTDSWGKMTSIPAAEARFVVEAAADGGDATLLGEATFEVLAGAGVNVKFTYPNSNESRYNKGNKETTAVLLEDGVQVAEGTFGFQMDPTFFFGAHFDYQTQEGKEYTVVFSEGSWYMYSVNENTGEESVVESSPEVKYTWVAGASEDPGQGGQGGEGWTFASVTPAQGEVQKLDKLSFSYPEGVMWAEQSAIVNISCPQGKTAQAMLMDNFMGACEATVLDQVLTTPGTYTMTIPAGTFSFNGMMSGEMTYEWTIAGETENPETPGGDVDGNKRQEQLFAAWDLGKKMLEEVSLETEGVSMVGVSFFNAGLNFTVPVRYNTNDEGKINWNNGTKLVFTAKDNITGIIIDGDWAQFAEADKGNYVNGAWSGLLKAGETLTLTANDGINIQSIIVLYNGAELQIEEGDQTKVEIALDITKTDWSKIGNANGETIGTVSNNTDKVNHYTFAVTCEEDADIYVTFVQLNANSGDIVTFDPQDLYKGYHYTLTVEAFDSPQYGAPAIATATYEFVGTGKEPTKTVDIAAALTGAKLGIYGYIMPANGMIEITFDAPVKNAKAWVAMGFEGSQNLSMTQKDSEGKVWSVDASSFLSAEGSIDLNVTAYDVATGLQIKGQNNDHSFAFTVSCNPEGGEVEPEPEVAGAVLTVAGQDYTLSTEDATEFGKLPAGSVFSYTLTQEDTKTVAFQIYDVTAQSILKSVVTKQSFTDGVATFELPLEYALASGHQYEAQFKEYNSMSTINKVPTAENNFKFSGTADVAVYSTVQVVNVTPGTGTAINDPNQTVSITFSEAIASLSVKAVLGQMASTNVPASAITTEDNITWTVQLSEYYFTEGSLSLNFYAIDNEGNRVTDPNDGVGSPETCYLQYGWASTYGLPTPTLVQNGKTYEQSVSVLNFKYDGIGLNQNNLNATWSQIVIEKDGEPMDITITEDMFSVLGDESVGGTQLNLTLPTPLEYNGVYTVKVPAYAFMLGHDNSNFLSGNAEYKFTITNGLEAGPTIALNITKTSWAIIGAQNGETIGTVSMEGAEAFDHIEAEIRCVEDPDQYITFANTNVNGGDLVCYAWEGGHYDLNMGYHYILTVKGFDVPYYGVKPVAETTYEFVGTGKVAEKLNMNLDIANVDLKEDWLMLNAYELNGTTFDVTFTEPVSVVKTWMALGQDGTQNITATKKSEDGTVWTINMPEDITTWEGAVNVMIQAWDAEGVQAKAWNGDHAFGLNLIVTNSTPDDADAIMAVGATANKVVYTLGGVRINAKDMVKGQTYIVNGVKVRK